MKHSRFAQRGQALVETVIFMPMLLLSLFGVLWAIRAAVQYERIELAVRYAGLFQETTPYTDFSLAAMYGELGPNAAAPPIPCASPPPTLLSDGAPYAAVPNSKVTSPPIFTPTTVQSATCNSMPIALAYGIDGSTIGTQTSFYNTTTGKQEIHTQIEDDVLQIQHPSISAQVGVPGYLVSAIGSLTTIASSSEYFERTVNVQQILFCTQPKSATENGAPITALNQQMTSTMKWSTDPNPNPTALTTPFPSGSPPPPISTPADANCTYRGPT